MISVLCKSLPANDAQSKASVRLVLLRLTITSWALLSLIACSTVNRSSVSLPEGPSRDHQVQLQIFLDSQNFGPGVVDGRSGEFTAKALAFYREKHGLAPQVEPDVSSVVPYTSYTIAVEDLSVLGTMASEPQDIAQQSRQPYVTLLELVAERFHTTQAFMRELNPGVNFEAATTGTVVKVPHVDTPFHADQFPSAYPKVLLKPGLVRSVTVDLRSRMLQVREGESLVAAFPITPGSDEHPAPVGVWKVSGAVPWPWYRYDEGVLTRGERTETFYNLPPGPNNPVGILWTGLNRPGVGIHGTPNPETIGRAGSHGCIRLANWDAAAFYTLAQKGMMVTIR